MFRYWDIALRASLCNMGPLLFFYRDRKGCNSVTQRSVAYISIGRHGVIMYISYFLMLLYLAYLNVGIICAPAMTNLVMMYSLIPC